MSLDIAIEALKSSHDREAFSCGVYPLDRYLRQQAGQDVKRRLGNCFIALDRNTGDIAAYYTLCASSVPVDSLPEAETRRLPYYRILPAVLIGRLAVDRRYQGRQVGAAMIFDAIQRSAGADPAAFTLLVDAKDERAAAFYRKHGFTPFASQPQSLFLPMATALKLLT